MQKLDEILNGFSTEEVNFLEENNFFYIHAKSEIIIQYGIENYLKKDILNKSFALETKLHQVIVDGCNQILHVGGMFEKKPLINLGVTGMNSLMKVFHFEFKSRKTKHGYYFNNQKGALDHLEFQHTVDKRKILVYNFCKYEF